MINSVVDNAQRLSDEKTKTKYDYVTGNEMQSSSLWIKTKKTKKKKEEKNAMCAFALLEAARMYYAPLALHQMLIWTFPATQIGHYVFAHFPCEHNVSNRWKHGPKKYFVFIIIDVYSTACTLYSVQLGQWTWTRARRY